MERLFYLSGAINTVLPIRPIALIGEEDPVVEQRNHDGKDKVVVVAIKFSTEVPLVDNGAIACLNRFTTQTEVTEMAHHLLLCVGERTELQLADDKVLAEDNVPILHVVDEQLRHDGLVLPGGHAPRNVSSDARVLVVDLRHELDPGHVGDLDLLQYLVSYGG